MRAERPGGEGGHSPDWAATVAHSVAARAAVANILPNIVLPNILRILRREPEYVNLLPNVGSRRLPRPPCRLSLAAEKVDPDSNPDLASDLVLPVPSRGPGALPQSQLRISDPAAGLSGVVLLSTGQMERNGGVIIL